MLNLRWPYTKTNCYSPWYTILWRTVWVGPAFIGRVLFVTGILMMYGPTEAGHAWDATR